MTAPVKIIAVLVARPGRAADLEALLAGMVGPSRAEPGNLRWDVWRDKADPNRFALDELYVDDAAITAHRETPHFKDYLSKIGDVAERRAFVLDAVDLA